MNGEPRKSVPKILNFRSALAIFFGLLLLVLANSEILISSKADHIVEQKSLLRSLIQEVGFALIVALIIWGMWEIFNQTETEEQWNARIERVAKSVFFGVFKRNFPEELIQEANLLLLEQNFVRTGFQVMYTLSDDEFEREDGRRMPYVRLEAITRFMIKNIGNSATQCPIRTQLPNPLHADMKTKCSVIRVQVRQGDEVRELDLAEATNKFKEQLADNTSHYAKFELPSMSLASGNEIEIIWHYVMAKEEEDTEVMQSLFPTDSIAINIVDQGSTKRIVRAKSIHRSELEKISLNDKNGTYAYRLDRYFLPRQGFVIWWKRNFAGTLSGTSGVAPEEAQSGPSDSLTGS